MSWRRWLLLLSLRCLSFSRKCHHLRLHILNLGLHGQLPNPVIPFVIFVASMRMCPTPSAISVVWHPLLTIIVVVQNILFARLASLVVQMASHALVKSAANMPTLHMLGAMSVGQHLQSITVDVVLIVVTIASGLILLLL